MSLDPNVILVNEIFVSQGPHTGEDVGGGLKKGGGGKEKMTERRGVRKGINGDSEELEREQSSKKKE